MYKFDDEPPVREIPPDPPNRARALTYTSLCRSTDGQPYQRLNAFKHGMFARHLLVPGDDPSELLRFKIGMIKSLNPNDTFQQMIAERIICAGWKLRRMEQAEQEMYISELNDPQNPAKSPGAAMVRLMKQGQAGMISEIERIQKYQQKLEGTINRNVKLLGKLQEEGWHLQGILSELCGELIEENESELMKIDPDFKAEILNCGWRHTRDPIHECVAEKKKQAEQEKTAQEAAAMAGQPTAQPANVPESTSTEINRSGPYMNPGQPAVEPRDLLGKTQESWNKIDLDDLKRRGREKSANLHESTRIAS